MRTYRMGLIQTEDQLKFSYLSIIQVFGWEGRGASGVFNIPDYRQRIGRVANFYRKIVKLSFDIPSDKNQKKM
jgi:hypothetical protein